jgi:YbgC/YbaW family acyl-CoA thioester hydrolase
MTAPFHFTYRRLVEFADTDVAGIMHFSNFFRFVECAEHAFFRSLDHPVHLNDGATQHGWPRLEVACTYHRAARFEQLLEVGLRIEELGTTTLRYRFEISIADTAPPALLATGAFTIIHVAIDTATHSLRKAPIPAPLRATLQSLLTAEKSPTSRPSDAPAASSAPNAPFA